MTHSTNPVAFRGLLLGAVLASLATLTSPRAAQASSNFPPELQKTLQKRYPGQSFCVPLCNACHLTTQGGPLNYNAFGQNLVNTGLGGPVPALVDPVVNAWLNKNLDSDGDGVTDDMELKVGLAPGFAGSIELCPTDAAQYGCGARIAKAPLPTDRLGLFSSGLAVLGLAWLRRRRTRPA